jgi:hypothetical protein
MSVDGKKLLANTSRREIHRALSKQAKSERDQYLLEAKRNLEIALREASASLESQDHYIGMAVKSAQLAAIASGLAMAHEEAMFATKDEE